MLLLAHYECKSLNLRVLHKPLMLELETARATLPVWVAQLLSPAGPFWSSPSTSFQFVPSTPGTSQSFCAPSSWCYCQWKLAHLSQLFSSAPSQPQSTSAGWWSAHFSSCIHGLICWRCCYDWKKTYSWIQVSDLHTVGGNTLIFYLTKREQYHSLMILGYKCISTSNLGENTLSCFLLRSLTWSITWKVHNKSTSYYACK